MTDIVGGTSGQAIGSVFGGIVGGVIGGFPGAMIGMALGGQLGRWIDPPSAPPPPALGDLGKNSYVRSTAVPLVFGQNKVHGGVIWVGELQANWHNTGSRKNPEYTPEMDIDYAVCHCEGEISYTGQYWIDNRRAEEMEDEGFFADFDSKPGSAGQSTDDKIAAWQGGMSVSGIPLKYSAYTVVDMHVENKILSSLPAIAAEIEGFNMEGGEEDANPIRALYNFLTDTRWGVGMDTDLFNGTPDTGGSPWETAADYCDESVQTIDHDGSPVSEPRFRFSNVYDTRTMAFDIITDILLTCRGILRVKQGKIEPLIENENESPEKFYTDVTEVEVLDTNIKEGSFNFKYTGFFDTSNKYRVEYIVRKVKDHEDNWRNEYIWDAVEKDAEEYYVDITQQTKLKTVRLAGIKRKSQAMRMAQFYSDFGLYNRNWCEFITDTQGYYHAIGDIIGVTHSSTGWVGKAFRIIGMEEMENHEVKLQCFEYHSAVYSDETTQVMAVEDNNPTTPYVAPDVIERFGAVQANPVNKIYILFKRPDDNPYFIGVNIHVSKNGGDWQFVKTIGYITPSVKLDAGIDDSQTTIPYDNSTVYGAFPATGSFWIDDELITYTGISDDPDYEFTGCTRGSSPTTHSVTKYCMLKDDYTDFITFEDSEVGQQWEIKAVSVTVFDLRANFSSSPSKVITIS